MIKILCVFLFFVLLITTRCLGQRFESNGINVSYSAAPNKSLKDSSGNFGYSCFDINARIPLFGYIKKEVKKTNADTLYTTRFYETSFHENFGIMPVNMNYINVSRNFYYNSLGGGIIFGSSKNIFSATANIGMAADGTIIQNNDIKYRFSGSFIIQHIQNPTTIYRYGAVFTYAYGKPLPLPVLGIYKRFSSNGNWSFTGLLPLSLKLTDRINTKSRLSFSVESAGNRFQFANQNLFKTTSSYDYLQLRQFRANAEYGYKISRYFSLNTNAGVLVARKLKFVTKDDNTVLYQANIQHGSYFNLSLRYALPRKKISGAENILMNENE